MSENFIVSIIFILYAGIAIFKADWLVRWQVWANKTILDADFKPGKRTYRVYQIMGILFAGFAVLIAFGVIE